MKIINLFVVIISVISFNSKAIACATTGMPPPAGLFGTTPDTIISCTGQAIEIQPNWVNPPREANVTFTYDWGDGNIDTVPPAGNVIPINTHVYIFGGDFTFVLIKSNPNGEDTTNILVQVFDPPIANLSIVPDTCLGAGIQFSDLSSPSTGTPIVSWAWNFGNDSTSSQQNPNFTYPFEGTYVVSLLVTNTEGCASSNTDTLIISKDLALDFLDVIQGCPCDEVQFNGSDSASTWNWDFGDGNVSTSKTDLHKYSLPGQYRINLSQSTSEGCTQTVSKMVSVCSSDTLWTSKSNNKWFFSKFSGMNFSSGAPVPELGGQANSLEGGSTISDPITGNMLFYSEGSTIWDATHTPMPNGSGLTGGNSAAQGTLIVPFPGDVNKYYLFTVNGGTTAGADEVRYSIIDMTLQGNGTVPAPLGDVVTGEKDVLLSASTGSECSAVTPKKLDLGNCNSKTEYWVMFYTNLGEFKSFLLTDTGISTPVVSNIGTTGNGSSFQSTFSPDGSLFVMTDRFPTTGGGFDLFDFDKSTGFLSNHREYNFEQTYGVHFSPDGNLLYVTTLGAQKGLWQFDITQQNILSTIQNIYLGNVLSMWTGDDGKIYATTSIGPGTTDIGVINLPNTKGLACNFNATGFNLGGPLAIAGLQNIQKLWVPTTPQDTLFANFIIDSSNCAYVDFINQNDICTYLGDKDTYFWDFGDGDTSTQFSPTHTYVATGPYTVQLIVTRPTTCTTDTIVRTVNIKITTVDISNDTVCLGDTTHFQSTVNDAWLPIKYDWSSPVNDTVANPKFVFSADGIFNIILSVTDNKSCIHSDTNNVLIKALPLGYANPDTTVCENTSVTLRGGALLGVLPISYNWFPSIDLNDSTISNPIATPMIDAKYSLVLTNECGTDTAMITIEVENCEIFVPNAFSPNGDGINDLFKIRGDGINKFLLKIYDRWGNKVFQAKGINDNWDGKNTNAGVYVYWLDVTLLNGQTVTRKGNLTLVK